MVEGSTWVFDNLTTKILSLQWHSWHTTFMVIAWFLWQWRNNSIFEEGFQHPNNEVEVILKIVDDINRITTLNQVNYGTDTTLVRWKHLEEGWLKLNSDGACRDNDNQAGCRGLFRDYTGK